MIYRQEYDLAEKLLKEGLCDDASPTQKAASYNLLAGCAEYRGNSEECLTWIDRSTDYIRRHPECGEDLAFNINSFACAVYTKFGMQDAARTLLIWLSERIGNRIYPEELLQYEIDAGTYELYFGEPEKALEHYQKAGNISEVYWENDPNQITLMGQTAIALQRLKRYREALDIYTAILDQLRNNGSDHQIHLYSNNISVVYLELDRPAEALSHLETALKPARQFGGIALGEVQRNRARAFGMLGNKAEELTCLEEAVPLLEKAYGAQHPRAQAARQRLEELEERKSSQ